MSLFNILLVIYGVLGFLAILAFCRAAARGDAMAEDAQRRHDAGLSPHVEPQRTVHYIGFRGDEYVRAYRLFGGPAMIHRVNDARTQSEIDPERDLAIYSGKEREDRPRDFIASDVTGPGWDQPPQTGAAT